MLLTVFVFALQAQDHGYFSHLLLHFLYSKQFSDASVSNAVNSIAQLWLCDCRVFLCYIELHGSVLDGFLCSHWILAFPQTLFLLIHEVGKLLFIFFPSATEKTVFSFWSLRLCGDTVSLLALFSWLQHRYALLSASSGSPAKIYFEFFLCLLMHDLLPLSSLGQLLETCFCGTAEPMLT